MTSALMEEWLKGLNQQMKIQKRKILLFMDNAACHPHIQLSNIKLAFFPPNTTSLTQPMDQGVIQNMKLHYRKLVLQSLCANMANCNSVTELSKKISALDAIRWISSATRRIKKECVQKCFKHAGFEFKDDAEVEVLENEMTAENITEENVQEIQTLMEELGDVSIAAENYIKIDDIVATEGGYQTLDDLVDAACEDQDLQEEEDEGQGLGKSL